MMKPTLTFDRSLFVNKKPQSSFQFCWKNKGRAPPIPPVSTPRS